MKVTSEQRPPGPVGDIFREQRLEHRVEAGGDGDVRGGRF